MLELAIMIEGQAGLNWPRWQRMATAARASASPAVPLDHFTIAAPEEDSLDLWVSLTWRPATQPIEFGPWSRPSPSAIPS
jgi:hypothetical protein